jgi:mitochondrial translocator assembly and maintenance protein 41
MISENDAKELMNSFPETDFAFAYGSGAIEQLGYDYKSLKGTDTDADGSLHSFKNTIIRSPTKNLQQNPSLPMLDFIFVVDDPLEWHTYNMHMNPNHYTPLFPLSSSQIAWFQDKVGARVWYNTLVPIGVGSMPQRPMKYGVISSAALSEDLTEWTHLYASGRLHKPVNILKGNMNLERDIVQNREQALAASLLLQQSESFTELDLFMGVAGLSYAGDPRMRVGGENPDKVKNLVSPVVGMYREAYSEPLASLSKLCGLEQFSDGSSSSGSRNEVGQLFSFRQNLNAAAKSALISRLPLSIRSKLSTKGAIAAGVAEESDEYLSQDDRLRRRLQRSLSAVVAKAAVPQSFKGLLSIGVVKCSQYIMAKMLKGGLKGFARAAAVPAKAALRRGAQDARTKVSKAAEAVKVKTVRSKVPAGGRSSR